MLSWVVQNFIFVIYSNATQLTYSLIALLAMARRVIWIRTVRPSVQKFFLNWFLVFFLKLHIMLGILVELCMTEPDFLKKMFYPQNGENRPSPGFFECTGKSSFFLSSLFFLSVWSIMKVCITVILVCLNKFQNSENSGSYNMDPKCSWSIRLQDFSINRRTLELAVSHKEINELNWLLVCPSQSFPRKGSLVFSDFCHSGR